nr:hypothetical protein GCM10025732_05860 [Glycomyces mayteni]
MDVGDLVGPHAPQGRNGFEVGAVVADGDLHGLARGLGLVAERPARQLGGEELGLVDAVDEDGGRPGTRSSASRRPDMRRLWSDR